MSKAFAAAIAVLMWACAGVAQAAEDRVVLADRASINAACEGLAARGVSCKFIPVADIDQASPAAHLWIPTSEIDLGMPLDIARADLGFLERSAGTQYYAQALIYPRSDLQGQQYYMVRMAMIRQLGSSDPSVTDLHEDAAWRVFGSALQAAAPDSAQTAAYLAVVDTQAAQQAEAKADAAKRAQAQQAYLNSPEYKRGQLRDDATKCQKTIAWAQRVIAQDDRVAAISGYHNINDRQSAAIAIVECQDKIRAARAIDRPQQTS